MRHAGRALQTVGYGHGMRMKVGQDEDTATGIKGQHGTIRDKDKNQEQDWASKRDCIPTVHCFQDRDHAVLLRQLAAVLERARPLLPLWGMALGGGDKEGVAVPISHECAHAETPADQTVLSTLFGT